MNCQKFTEEGEGIFFFIVYCKYLQCQCKRGANNEEKKTLNKDTEKVLINTRETITWLLNRCRILYLFTRIFISNEIKIFCRKFEINNIIRWYCMSYFVVFLFFSAFFFICVWSLKNYYTSLKFRIISGMSRISIVCCRSRVVFNQFVTYIDLILEFILTNGLN